MKNVSCQKHTTSKKFLNEYLKSFHCVTLLADRRRGKIIYAIGIYDSKRKLFFGTIYTTSAISLLPYIFSFIIELYLIHNLFQKWLRKNSLYMELKNEPPADKKKLSSYISITRLLQN